MVADDPRTRTRSALQAVAFGRVVTPEDQAAAARALEALRALDERVGPALEPVMVDVVDDSRAMSHGDWSGNPNRFTETLRRLWVVPVVVASLALGAVAGSVATHAAENSLTSSAPVGQATTPANSVSTNAPSDATAAVDPVIPDQSSDSAAVLKSMSDAAVLAGADALLSQPHRPADNFPDESRLTAFEIDPNSTHLVTSEGTTSFWIARAMDGQLCLALVEANSDMGFSLACVEPELFPGDGVSIGAPDGASARWDANGINYDFGNNGAAG